MPIDYRNRFYDQGGYPDYGNSPAFEDEYGAHSGLVHAPQIFNAGNARFVGGLAGGFGALGGTMYGLRRAGLNPAALLANRSAPNGLLTSIAETPMDILGPNRRQGINAVTGRKGFIPRTQLGTLFQGSPTGLAGRSIPAGGLAYTPEMIAAAEGQVPVGILNNPAAMQQFAKTNPELFQAPASRAATAAPKTGIAAAQEALATDALGKTPPAATAKTGVMARLTGPGAARTGLRIGAPIVAGLVAPELEDAFDDTGVGKSGLLGDIVSGATVGTGLGTAVYPGWGSLAGAVLGGIHGGITGDRNPNETPEVKEFDDYILGSKNDDGVFTGGGAIDTLRAYVDKGVISEEEAAVDERLAQYQLARGFGDKSAEDAYNDTFGELDEKIMAYEQEQIATGGTGTTGGSGVAGVPDDLWTQLAKIHADQQATLREAERGAIAQMAPMQAEATKLYQDLAGVRDARLADPNVPADMRASAQAMAPMMDAANLRVVQAAANPLSALIAQNEAAYQQDLDDQLIQLYLAQLQYSGGGGGGGADSLSDLLLNDPTALGGTDQSVLPGMTGTTPTTGTTGTTGTTDSDYSERVRQILSGV